MVLESKRKAKVTTLNSSQQKLNQTTCVARNRFPFQIRRSTKTSKFAYSNNKPHSHSNPGYVANRA